MKKWKNLSRRGLAMALAMTVCLSFSQLTAFADEMDDDVSDSMTGGETIGDLPKDTDIAIPLQTVEELNAYAEMAELSPEDMAEMGMVYPMLMEGFGPSLLSGEMIFDAEKYAEWRGLELDGIWDAEGNWADGSPIMEIDAEGNAKFFEPKGPMGEATVTYTFEKPVLPDETDSDEDETSSEESDDASSEESSEVSSEKSSETSSEESSETSSEDSSETSSEVPSKPEESSDTSSEESSKSEEPSSSSTELVVPSSADTTSSGETITPSAAETSKSDEAASKVDASIGESHADAKDAGVAVFAPRMLFDEGEGNEPEEIEEEPLLPETPAETVTLEWKVVVTSNVNLAAAGSWSELKTDLESGKSVTLDKDIVITAEEAETTITIGKTVELNLNGHTISYADGVTFGEPAPEALKNPKGSMFTITGGTFTLSGEGKLQGYGSTETDTRNPYSLVVVNGGTFDMKGGTITGNYKGPVEFESVMDGDKDAPKKYAGAGVYVMSGAFMMYGGTISNNHTIYRESAPLTDKPSGDQLGEWDKYYAYYGGTNGKNTAKYYSSPLGQGGGVYVANKAEFTLSGGTISENHASEGGGVFVAGTFTMNSGKVSSNIAYLGEGGGVYISSPKDKISSITGGEISYNETHTSEDLGGGGIYVENGSKLKMTNALVTENTAEGLGGGIAACVHGHVALLSVDGVAAYKNTANKKGHVVSFSMEAKENNNLDAQNGEKYTADFIDRFAQWENEENFKNAAVDVFSAGADSQGNAGAIVSNNMAGGGLANWTGWKNDKKDAEFEEITLKNNGAISAKNLLALTADPTAESIEKAETICKGTTGVIIKGNSSTKTHGGGIATNGVLVLGEKGESVSSEGAKLTINKTLTGRDMKAGEFTFELLKNDKVVSSVKNVAAEDGAAAEMTLEIPAKELKEGENTFTVREAKDNPITGVKYDEKQYTVKVMVATDVISGSQDGYTVTAKKVESVKVFLNDEKVENGVLSFTNTMEYCSLTVTKELKWPVSSKAPENKNFTINVKLGKGSTKQTVELKTEGDKQYVDYVAEGIYELTFSFDDKGSKSIEIRNIPKGMTYSVEETKPEEKGYTEPVYSVSGTQSLNENGSVTVTNNFYEPNEISISVQKNWVDQNDEEYKGNLMPESVTVQLMKDDDPEGEEVTLNKDNWNHTWENLPEYPNEASTQKHVYTVVETGVSYGEGYTVTKSSNGTVFFVEEKGTGKLLGGWRPSTSKATTDGVVTVTLTNKWAPVEVLGTFSLTINKVDSRDGKTPIDDATFELTKTSENFVYRQTTTNGTITFEALPMGNYVLKETAPAPGYRLPEKNSWNITIDEKGDASVVVTKPADSDGSSEPSVDVEAIVELKANTIVIKNDIIKGKIRLTKTVTGVDNIPAEKEFTFNVYSIEREGAGIPVGAGPAATLKAVHNATDTTAELPYGWYAIVETGNTAIGGYVFNGVTFDGTANRYDVFVGEGEKHNETYTVAAVNNYRVPEPEEEEETTSVSVNKVWVGDTAANRPASITVNLLRDGEVYDTVTLSARNGWYASWSNLDDESSWTVEEVNVPEGYTSAISGRSAFTITNTFTTEEEIPEEEIPEEDTPLSDTPEVVVPEIDTPLADKPVDEEETIVDEDIPLADVPKTGDHANVTLWAALLAASLAGLLALVRKIRGEDK